ncbi:MAG: bifunctional methylenetetrahydrofolate dehydrogenase/methenyltetrahydrofolate cyclohydrolase FolD [Fimbriimonadaceae bacterium]|nr:bifunctional methylenetetrahydrofolate dehydrogenase/methenyltetrahydrofolate cyclohydrolase FolD [Alphaproteobacteria bacterium]
MTANILDGKAIAADIREKVANAVAILLNQNALVPGLAVVLVGNDPASEVYVRNKGKMTLEVGMKSFEYRLSADTSEDDLLVLIDRLNNDPAVHGILVQLPLPDQINSDKVINAIDPDKDVDGFHVINAGRLATGQRSLVPCTPAGCVVLAKRAMGNLGGAEAVIVGRSNIVGKPLMQLLLAENCTVTVAHSRTKNLADVCRRADLLVVAVGRERMVKGDWIKPGATVIDVGINRIPAPEKGEGKTRLVGDVDYDGAVEVAGAITPVPGGVGPMTIALLLANTVVAACTQNGLDAPDLFS